MNATEYRAATASATPAEAYTFGALRGGWLVGDRFMFCGAGGYHSVPVADVRDLRTLPR